MPLAADGGVLNDFNHIHVRHEGEWICGRSMSFEDQELIRCEARHSSEYEACQRCAEQLLGYFGDIVYVQ